MSPDRLGDKHLRRLAPPPLQAKRGVGCPGNEMTLADDVVRKIELIWSAAQDRQRARELLATYGLEDHERERDRVHLAILKLSEGSTDKLHEIVQAAKNDYRDVLMWAEYPEEGQALWSLRSRLSVGEQERLAEIRARDRKQYEEWRNK